MRIPQLMMLDREGRYFDAGIALVEDVGALRLEADAHHRIAAHVRHLRSTVMARAEYGLVHGELGPDHVLVTPAGEAIPDEAVDIHAVMMTAANGRPHFISGHE